MLHLKHNYYETLLTEFKLYYRLIDKTNPKNGFFELDWNEYFVQSLKLNGYRGTTDEEVVDKWFQDLCRNVASDSGTEDVGASGYVNKVLRDDGKTEVS